MAPSNVDRELSTWLDQHGYRHAHARVQKTPQPYVATSLTGPGMRTGMTRGDIAARKRAGDVLVQVGDWKAAYTTGSGLRGKVQLGLKRVAIPSFTVLERDPRDGDTFDSVEDAQLYALNAGRIGWRSEQPEDEAPAVIPKVTAANRGKYRTSRR